MRLRSRRTKHGFTLIELLVVIAIIAILSAILFPVFVKAKSTAKQARCLSNIKQCSLAYLAYVDDYHGRTPPYLGRVGCLLPWQVDIAGAASRTAVLTPYLKSVDVATCPEYQAAATSSGTTHFGSYYGYNGVYLLWGGRTDFTWTESSFQTSLVQMSQVQAAPKTILFIDCWQLFASSPKADGLMTQMAWWYHVAKADRHSNGWNVGMCDGHARWYSSASGNVIAKNDYLWALNKTKYRSQVGPDPAEH